MKRKVLGSEDHEGVGGSKEAGGPSTAEEEEEEDEEDGDGIDGQPGGSTGQRRKRRLHEDRRFGEFTSASVLES